MQFGSCNSWRGAVMHGGWETCPTLHAVTPAHHPGGGDRTSLARRRLAPNVCSSLLNSRAACAGVSLTPLAAHPPPCRWWQRAAAVAAAPAVWSLSASGYPIISSHWNSRGSHAPARLRRRRRPYARTGASHRLRRGNNLNSSAITTQETFKRSNIPAVFLTHDFYHAYTQQSRVFLMFVKYDDVTKS